MSALAADRRRYLLIRRYHDLLPLLADAPSRDLRANPERASSIIHPRDSVTTDAHFYFPWRRRGHPA